MFQERFYSTAYAKYRPNIFDFKVIFKYIKCHSDSFNNLILYGYCHFRCQSIAMSTSGNSSNAPTYPSLSFLAGYVSSPTESSSLNHDVSSSSTAAAVVDLAVGVVARYLIQKSRRFGVTGNRFKILKINSLFLLFVGSGLRH